MRSGSLALPPSSLSSISLHCVIVLCDGACCFSHVAFVAFSVCFFLDFVFFSFSSRGHGPYAVLPPPPSCMGFSLPRSARPTFVCLVPPFISFALVGLRHSHRTALLFI